MTNSTETNKKDKEEMNRFLMKLWNKDVDMLQKLIRKILRQEVLGDLDALILKRILEDAIKDKYELMRKTL